MSLEQLSVKVNAVESILYYQIDCIKKHPEMPILPIHVAIFDHQVSLENDVFDHIRMSEYLDEHSLDKEEWILMLLSLGEMLQRSMDHFLDAVCFDISLATMFYPLDKGDSFHPENIRYRYVPVARDSTSDPLCDFIKEINLILASLPVSSGSVSGSRSCEPVEKVFSQEELDCIAGWSLKNLKQGLEDIRVMLNHKNEPLSQQKRRFLRFPSMKRPHPVVIPETAITKSSVPFGSSSLFIILGAELVLILLAFQVLYHQSGFHQRITPVLLVSGILLCFGILDLFLLFSTKSPLCLDRSKQEDTRTGDERGAVDSIFKSKEEKTVHLVLSEEPRRIAMITSGIPGTLEESAGLKAYILVDDFLIGRDGGKVDFKINSLSIGRIHARIIRKEDSFFIEDMESKNGTFLDQRKLRKHEEVLLPEKCKLRFADREFYFVAN